MKVLAAVSDRETGGTVLAVAQALATRLGTQVEAVHVTDESNIEAARGMAARAQVPLTVVVSTEAPATALATLLDNVDVLFIVLGARDEIRATAPVGHVALAVASQVVKPVVLVPPMPADVVRPLERVLVPLDGRPETAQALSGALRMFGGFDVEVVGLHVFGDETVPRFWDKPDHEEAVWGDEFAARNVGAPEARLELRLGSPAEAVVELTEQECPGLVLMAWSQRMAPGRATVVSEVLRRCHVPVVLVPVASGPVRTFVPGDSPVSSRD